MSAVLNEIGRPIGHVYNPGNIVFQGADPDGGTSDSTAALVAALEAAADGGGEVEIPIGTFNISSTNALSDAAFSEVLVWGHGNRSVLNFTGTGSLFELSGSATLMQFERFKVVGNSLANAAFRIGNTGRAHLDRIYYSGFTKSTGSEADRGYFVVMDDASAGFNTISRCQGGDGYGGIYSVANGNVIDSFIAEVLTGAAVYVTGGAASTSIFGLRAQTVAYGLRAPNAADLFLCGGYLEGCSVYSVHLGESSQVRGGEIRGVSFGGATGEHHIRIDLCDGYGVGRNFFNTSGSIGLIRIAGAESTIDVEIEAQGISQAMVTADTYTLLTEDSPLRYGYWLDKRTNTYRYGSMTAIDV